MAQNYVSPLLKPQDSPLQTWTKGSAFEMEDFAENLKIPRDIEMNEVFEKANQDTPESLDAALLLEVSAIATKEYRVGGSCVFWGDEGNAPRVVSIGRTHSEGYLSAGSSSSDSGLEDDPLQHMTTEERFQWNRIRAVSIDCHEDHSSRLSPPTLYKGCSNVISPGSSPVSTRRRRRAGQRPGNNKRRSDSPIVKKAESKGHRLQPSRVPKGLLVKTILRKKFSWKNYPELEAFLIANREEYLRHSALNYTVQQKQYNNRLTERLLELSADHGYVFDEDEFNFVTVRDRIRCYFKSYVQSAKKRGVIIGYAARKAGLLSEDDLHAGVKGQIVDPSSS